METGISRLTELQIQIRIVQEARKKFPHACELLYFTPNGANTNKIRGNINKLAGIVSGIPDLCLPYASRPYHGLYIEVKKGKTGKLSANQKNCMEILTGNGFCAVIARSVDEGLRIINDYLVAPNMLKINREFELG